MRRRHMLVGLIMGLHFLVGCHHAYLRSASTLSRERLNDVVYFGFGSWVPGSGQQGLLADKISLLKKDKNSSVVLEGHTDPVGSEDYNLHLGDQRARKVKAELVKGGIEPGRLAVVSYGKSRTISRGMSQKDFHKDRRVEFNVR